MYTISSRNSSMLVVVIVVYIIDCIRMRQDLLLLT